MDDIIRLLTEVATGKAKWLTIQKGTAECWIEDIDKELKEAFQAGRKAGLGEARERLDAMADDYSMQADKALDSYGPVPYYTCLDKANALREGASAVEALAGGGEVA